MDEYRKTIGRDAALERRFQPVQIEEPTVESTISILRGLKPRYEVHHGVEISDGALVTGEDAVPANPFNFIVHPQPPCMALAISRIVIFRTRQSI